MYCILYICYYTGLAWIYLHTYMPMYIYCILANSQVHVECRYTHYTWPCNMKHMYTSGTWLFLDFDLFQRSTRANRSRQPLKKIEERRSTGAIISFGIKGVETVKNISSFFESERSRRFFFKDRRVDSLTVNLFQRSTRPIRAWSIFLKIEKSERESKDQKIEFPILKKTDLRWSGFPRLCFTLQADVAQDSGSPPRGSGWSSSCLHQQIWCRRGPSCSWW